MLGISPDPIKFCRNKGEDAFLCCVGDFKH